MDKIKKYQKQIVTFIVIFLLLEFGIFPSLTAASTAFNVLGGVGLLLLIVWGCLALYDWAKYSEEEEEEEAEEDIN